MKIMLIHPPAEHMLSTNVPRFVDEHTGYYPPLGLLYIIGSLEKHVECDVKFIDAQAHEMGQAELKTAMEQFHPDIVGIQMMTFTSVDAYMTAKTAKSVNNDIFVVVGGPHPNIYPDETLAKSEIDCIVLGEGEETFVDLVRRRAAGKPLDDMKNIAFKKPNGEIVKGCPGKIEDLDSLPFPARHHLDLDKYYTIIGQHRRMTTFVSSRGCPFRCLFCDRAYYGKLYRKRTPENVVDEIEQCVAMGIEEFDFQDDAATIIRQRIMGIADEIMKRNVKIHWDLRSRVDGIDDALLEKLAAAGVNRIHYGIEAGTQEIIKVLRKEIDLEKAIKVFRMTKKHGIDTLAYFIIGSPFETRDHILRSIDYMLRLDPDYIHVGIMTPFPSTDLYTLGLERKVYPYDYWKEFAEKLNQDFVPPFWEEELSREELCDLLKLVFKRFYGRPKYIMRELMKVRSLTEFTRKAKAGMAMFRYW